MTNAEQVVREFYKRIGESDVAGVLELMSDHIVWTVPGAVPYAGTFRGKDEVLAFFRLLYDHEELESFVPDLFIVDDQLGIVCVAGSETAIAKPTGRKFSVRWIEVFWVVDELIVEFDEHIDTLTMAHAYGGVV